MPRNHDVRPEREPIAIVGIGCRLPGGITSPASFWRVLHDGTDTVGEIPQSRLDLARPYGPEGVTSAGGAWAPERHIGGTVEGVDRFDAMFFRISPREAERLDPQQRLLLEVAWDALEDGGQPAAAFRGIRSGIFVGLWLSDYEQYLIDASDQPDFYMTVGSGRYAAAGRLSYVLDSQGPSLTLDTACSSSLVAVHLACRSIWQGEVDIALAGGANVILANHITAAYARAGMLAPDGRCKFGDASANGYVRSDGAAAVVLKPLSRAIADGDPIYALIRGGAVNNDGQTGGHLVTPATEGQEQLLRAAYQDAGIDPSDIDYVEAHGTGTAVGDPVELRALGAVVGRGRAHDQPCFVGSVKTNIGHTEGAAGVAGLIKVALALKHGEIPATLHCSTPTPAAPWGDLALALPAERRPWPQTGRPSRAGVSSFGITGTNAHIVLEAAPYTEPAVTDANITSGAGLALAPLSGHTLDALRARAAQIADVLSAADQRVSVADLCYTAAVRRTHHGVRWAAVSESREDLLQQLRAVAASDDDMLTPPVSAPPDQRGVVFVFPGQGSQWGGMARDLLESEPAFRAALEQCERAFDPYVDWSLLAELRSGAAWERIDLVQPTLFALQVALAALWKRRGIRPSAVVGHSMGEVGAAYVAGLLSLDDAARVICGRSRLLRRVSGQGAMAVVELTLAEAERVLAGYEDRLSIAVSNSSRSTVIAGAPDALHDVLETLRLRDIFCRLISVDVASHSPQVEPLQQDLMELLADLKPLAGDVPFYSSVHAARLEGALLNADYWFQNLRQPVRFGQTVAELLEAGHRVFIELSPHPVLLSPLQQSVREAGREVLALPSLRRETASEATLLDSLATLYAAGYDIDWAALYPNGGAYVPLPGYPWQRERFWYEPAVRAPEPAQRGHSAERFRPTQSGYDPLKQADSDVGMSDIGSTAIARDLPRAVGDEQADNGIYELVWRMTPALSVQNHSAAPGTWVILADERGIGQMIADLLIERGQRCTILAAAASPASGDASSPAVLASALVTHLQAGLDVDQPPIRGIVDVTALTVRPSAEASEPPATAAVHKAVDALTLSQALLTLVGQDVPTLWIVTAGVQAVSQVAAESSLAQSPLWGFWRSLRLEESALDCRLVDLEASPSMVSLRALVVELLAADATQPTSRRRRDDQLAWRHGQRYVARLVRRVATAIPGQGASVTLTVDGRDVPVVFYDASLEAVIEAFRRLAQGEDGHQITLALDRDPAATPTHGDGPTVRSDGTYLITGGLGALGLATAQWLVHQGARAVALVGRRPPSAAAQRVLDQLEQSGAQILVASVDVANRAEVSAVLQHIEGTMPPLRGVIHAAGLLADVTVQRMDGPRLAAVMAPKVEGAWNLHELTEAAPLELFVMFSSVTAALGSPGQANYAASNAFLDALAHYRRANGRPGLSINWGPWAEIGLAASQTDRGERLAARGIGSLDPKQAFSVIGRLLDENAVAAIVMPFAAHTWCAAYPAAGRSALFDELIDGEDAASGAERETSQVAHQRDVTTPSNDRDNGGLSAVHGEALSSGPSEQTGTVPLRQRLEVAAPADRARLLTGAVVEAAARIMGYRPTQTVAENRGFFAIGMDSLTAIELRQRLEGSLHIVLPATVVFDYPTPAVLATYLVQRLFPDHELPQDTTAPNERADADFGQLSDDELRDLLDRELESLDARSLS